MHARRSARVQISKCCASHERTVGNKWECAYFYSERQVFTIADALSCSSGSLLLFNNSACVLLPCGRRIHSRYMCRTVQLLFMLSQKLACFICIQLRSRSFNQRAGRRPRTGEGAFAAGSPHDAASSVVAFASSRASIRQRRRTRPQPSLFTIAICSMCPPLQGAAVLLDL